MSNWTVDVQDFQSIKKAHIEVPDGLTVITGKTNEGKSAIFRAIDNAIFNTGTDDMVRSGRKIAGVTISNGIHTMTYCRNAVNKNEKTAYQFDGGPVQKKVGRSQLPEVSKLFGITDVRMQNGVKVKLNFWYQNDKPFLMDKTAGQLYEFLSLSSADKYFKILKSMAADIKVQEAEINNSNTVIDTLKSVNNSKKELLDKNKGFDDVYTQIITAGQEADKLNRSISIIENLGRIQDKISEVSAKLKEASDRYNSIPIDVISDSYSRLDKSNTDYLKLYGVVSSVASTRNQIKIVNSCLSKSSESYESYQKAMDYAKPNIESIDYVGGFVLRSSDLISKCNSISEKIDSARKRISDLENKCVDLSDISDKLGELSSGNDTQLVLNQMVTSVQSLSDSVLGLSNKISGVLKDISDKEIELEEFKSQVGYCPFCGSVFDKSKGHSH